MRSPTIFDVTGGAVAPARLVLKAMERRTDDLLWPRYRVHRP